MMLNPEGIPLGPNGTEAAPDPNAALRFEDLTIDDELTLLDRVVRYVRSGIALQRLVHVKMIAETAKSVGPTSTMRALVPLFPPLVADQESIIRQHLATQMLPISLTCMLADNEYFNPEEIPQSHELVYNEDGYKIVTSTIINHINTLITDTDMDVRKAASDALATLALYVRPEDVISTIIPIALRLIDDESNRVVVPSVATSVKKTAENYDELCITASNLLADLASVNAQKIPPKIVAKYITPAVNKLCNHPTFRVRRAAVQALPRIVNGSSIEDVHQNLIPCFTKLAEDQMYRVRKSVGECLVDMSRSLMFLPYCSGANVSTSKKKTKHNFLNMDHDQLKGSLMELRRETLVPICAKLLQDSSKLVRQGMMQFLGPFIASFYPLEGAQGGPKEDGIINLLEVRDDENIEGGMGVQFFPHANGMVSRLNPSNLTTVGNIPPPSPPKPNLDSSKYLQEHLPSFLEKNLNDANSLRRILHHRDNHPVSMSDIRTVQGVLLPPYVELATINTGDDTVDSEMRVYCAYSLPAVLLLLGKNGWDTSLKDCFLALITGWDGTKNEKGEPAFVSSVPLPVKRCLASSFHTVCHMLGPQAVRGTSEDKSSKRDLLSIFETHFLRDSDDTVRLNVIRNLISFLSLLSQSKRSNYLPVLYEVITGDSMLASKRTNARNPMVLNWRQRDMVAQILPNLMILYKPTLIRQYLWPIVKILLCDSVNVVRENTEWSLPVILRIYEVRNCQSENNDSLSEATKFSGEVCEEVIMYLQAILLDDKAAVKGNGKVRSSGAFSNRQGYCRILSAVALALRFNEKNIKKKKGTHHNTDIEASHPFQNFTHNEYQHVHRILKNQLLPLAIVMKDDKVTNVRLALAKSLRFMPLDIRENVEVSSVLRTLEDEINTWEGGGGLYLDGGDRISGPSRNENTSRQESRVKFEKNTSSMQYSESSQNRERRRRHEDDSKSLASI